MLLVEDNSVAGTALSALLTRRGYQVTRAETVADAVAHLGSGYAVVILDLMLPDGDGAIVLERVRATEPSAHAPRVLVTTASDDPARLSAVRALEPDALLRKPIDLSELLRLMAPTH